MLACHLQHVLPDRKTFAKDLDKAYAAMEKELKNKLDAQDYVSATADIWSSNNKSFLGVTVHWIDEGRLQSMYLVVMRGKGAL